MKTKNNVIIAEFLQLDKVVCNTLKTVYYKQYEEIGNPHSLAKWYEPHQLEFDKNIKWLKPVIKKLKESNPDNAEISNILSIDNKDLIYDFCVSSITNN